MNAHTRPLAHRSIVHAAAFALVAAALAMPAQALTKDFNQTYPLRQGGTVSLDNVNGDVKIVVWDRSEVSVEATVESKTQAGLDRIEIKVRATEDAVRIETEYAKNRGFFDWNEGGEVFYELKVPRHAELREIDLVNGSLRLEGVEGKVKASAVNGKIVAENLLGDVDIDTVNGKIFASFVQVGDGQRIKIDSVNGSIEVKLPRNADAEVQISTVHGDIDNDFGLKVDDGDFVGHDLDGRLGNGSARIEIDNVNGSVDLLANN